MRAEISSQARSALRRGFTLLEMCIVLFIIALLAGVAMPAMDSAFNERALRNDSHAFSIMVKTAMIRSSEEQRPYVIRLDGKELSLERPGTPDEADAKSSSTSDEATADTETTDTQTLDNAIKFPDAEKKNTWDAVHAITWTFRPGGLCPLPRVRFERRSAYIELSFNALTGDVEDEGNYLP